MITMTKISMLEVLMERESKHASILGFFKTMSVTGRAPEIARLAKSTKLPTAKDGSITLQRTWCLFSSGDTRDFGASAPWSLYSSRSPRTTQDLASLLWKTSLEMPKRSQQYLADVERLKKVCCLSGRSNMILQMARPLPFVSRLVDRRLGTIPGSASPL